MSDNNFTPILEQNSTPSELQHSLKNKKKEEEDDDKCCCCCDDNTINSICNACFFCGIFCMLTGSK